MENLEELRRLAEQATPGPWAKGPGGLIEKSDEPFVEVAHSHSPENRAYIAAASPQTILSLLDERDRQAFTLGRLLDDLDKARRRVAALEEGLRNLIEAWDKRANYNTGEQVKALIPSIIQARSLLQSSAASQGDEE